ncbi:MAG: hypothetical protein AMDU5_GPLC00018G0001 [Thermoplasmatales archaeon Gpl]|nr:MAG: hypothetical protein AMDU5_GPLC00018G0001 [Thermoplasmatales archaeon Gpl]
MIEVSNNSVLIVIDAQKGFDDPKWGKRNNPNTENVMTGVLSEFRKHKLTVIHVRHDSMKPESLLKKGKPTFAFKDEVKPLEGEIVITKHVNSAFIGTNLEEILRKMGDSNVYYMGITTDHCVSTTARMSGNLGFKSYVIEDACATFEKRDQHGKMIPADTIHNVNLASIHGEFAEVIRSADLVF